VDGFEVLNRRCSAEIENILAHAEVASTPALAGGDMWESMFDAHPLSQLRAARRGGLHDAELLLQPLIDCVLSLRLFHRQRTGLCRESTAVDSLITGTAPPVESGDGKRAPE
jgi:hypothetical protein